MKTYKFFLFFTALLCSPGHALDLASAPREVYLIQGATPPALNAAVAYPVTSAHINDSEYFIANYSNVYLCTDVKKSCSIFKPIFPDPDHAMWVPTKLTWWNGKLFIANYTGNNILIGEPDFSSESIRITDQIVTPETISPEGLDLSDDGKWLVSANSDGGSISFFHDDGSKWSQVWNRPVPFPHGVDIDNGIVYITSLTSRVVTLFSLKTGEEISSIGEDGWSAKRLGMLWPTSIIKHDAGVVVTDAHTGRITMLNNDLTVNRWFGCNGAGAANLNMPYSSEVYKGRLYVLSTFQNRMIEIGLSEDRVLRDISFGPSIIGGNGPCIGKSYSYYTNTKSSVETPFGPAKLGYRTLSADSKIINAAKGLFNPADEFYFLQAVKIKSIDGILLFSPQMGGGEVYLQKSGLMFTVADIPLNSWVVNNQIITPNGKYDLATLESRIKQKIKQIGLRHASAFSPDDIYDSFFIGDYLSKNSFYDRLRLSFTSNAGKQYWSDYQAGKASAPAYYRSVSDDKEISLSEFVLVGLLSGTREMPALMNEATNAYKKGNYYSAAEKLKLPANAGIAQAQTLLGFMYDNGEGGPVNYSLALMWYRKAAAQGYANAQYNLGMMYGNGLGVPQDRGQALKWFRLAAAGGNVDAEIARKEIEASMVPEQIKKMTANTN